MEYGSAEWLEDRKKFIGGSEIAAALGMSKWRTPFQLWEQKVGLAEPENDNWNMARGRAMEPLLRQHFADITGLDVSLPSAPIVHPKHKWMRYSPDGMCTGKVLVELKTATRSTGWGETDTDEIPQEYILQIQQGLCVLDYDVAKCSVSIGGGEPKYYEIEPDKELQEMLIEGGESFWDKVVNRIPPDSINNEDCARIYKKVNGLSIMAEPHISGLVASLVSLRAGMKDCEAQKEKLEVEIKSFIGENEVLTNENGVPIITWKAARGAERLDTKAVKENEPEIWERYIKIGEPTRRFLVK